MFNKNFGKNIMAKYESYDTGQQYLDMINLEEELPQDNRAKILKKIVCNLDLSSFSQNYNNDEKGASARNVTMMVGLLFLAHVRNIRGSRSIKKLCQSDIEFKYILSGNNIPDDSTIRLFRRRHRKELSEQFSRIIHIASAIGMIDFGALAIDGTKIKAYASLYETKNKRKLKKSIALLSRRMEKILQRLEASETQEEQNEFNKRLTTLKKQEKILNDFNVLLADCDEDESVNRVDQDARLMQKADGKTIIGYNAQAGVECGEHGIIVSADVSQNATDEKLFEEIRDQAEENAREEFDTSLGDAGYVTYETMEKAAHAGKDILGPDKMYDVDRFGKNKRGKYSKSNFTYDNFNDCYYCPEKQKLELYKMLETKNSPLVYVYQNKVACALCKKSHLCLSKNGKYRSIHRDYREMLRERMRERLESNQGYLLYGKRSQTVETAFGNIKENRGVRQFFYRGLENVKAEWQMICTGVNLDKIVRFLQGKDWEKILRVAMDC